MYHLVYEGAARYKHGGLNMLAQTIIRLICDKVTTVGKEKKEVYFEYPPLYLQTRGSGIN